MTSALPRATQPTAAARPRRRLPRPSLVGAGLLLLLAVAVAAGLAVGARSVALPTVLQALLQPGTVPPELSTDVVVVRELRLPRTVIGLLVGAALGAAGVVMQGITRNPVADPGLLGINAGASLAVVLGLTLTGASSVLGIAGFALAGALAACSLIATVAVTARTGSNPALLVVAGAAVTAGLTSLTTLVLLSNPSALDRYRFWTVGSLTGRGLGIALVLAPLVLVGLLLAVALSRALDALALGDDVARGLGFRLLPVRIAAIGAVVLLCGTATALAGPLVFVGLLGAHAARALVRGHARMLPAAAVAGATIVLLADVAGRVVAPPGELEVGIVVAAIGAPLLVALVRSRRGMVL